MEKYEYVTKKEYSPVRREIEKIIGKVKKIMENEEDTTFYYDLIGSGNRYLITRLKNGNKGFDFDYNLVIDTPTDFTWRAKEVKLGFIRAFNKALKGTGYKFAEDSTSVITIKKVDTCNSKIIHSCDFAIIYYVDEEDFDKGYYYINNYKNGGYGFVHKKQTLNVDSMLYEIEDYYDAGEGWNKVRNEYIKLKNRNNDINKHSFILYFEAIKNVYNHMHQEIEKYD